MQRSLQDEGAEQAMRVELARMQRASSAAGNNLRVPTLEQLLAAAANQEVLYMSALQAGQAGAAKQPLSERCSSSASSGRTWLCTSWSERSHTAPAPISGSVSGVRFLAAQIRSWGPGLPGTSGRGLAIARQQSDWWTAHLAYRLAVLATNDQVAAIPPAEAAGLLAEADAGYSRCHTVLPWRWVAELKRGQLAGRAMRPAIEAHTERGAAGWDSALRQLASKDHTEGSAAGQARFNATARCAGCGRCSLALHRCAACQSTLNCRWVGG